MPSERRRTGPSVTIGVLDGAADHVPAFSRVLFDGEGKIWVGKREIIAADRNSPVVQHVRVHGLTTRHDQE